MPTIERAEPSNLLIAGDQNILVDTGDGTVNQLARTGLSMGSINTVFISHHHHDHNGGLAAVIGLRWMNNFPGVVTVYGPPGTREIVDGVIKLLGPQSRIGFGLGSSPSPPAKSVRVVEIDGTVPVQIGSLVVRSTANSHFDSDGKAAAGGAVSLSYRFELGSRSITYTGDTGPSEKVEKLASETDMLVSEVIDLERLVAQIKRARGDMSPEMFAGMRKHLSTHHLLASDIGKMASRARAKRVVLTHFAIPGPISESEPDFRREVGSSYRGPLDLARDLTSFDVGCS